MIHSLLPAEAGGFLEVTWKVRKSFPNYCGSDVTADNFNKEKNEQETRKFEASIDDDERSRRGWSWNLGLATAAEET